MCRAVMGLPRWKRTGGRDFVFYHSHPGFEWDDLDVTTAYQEIICNDFQARPLDLKGTKLNVHQKGAAAVSPKRSAAMHTFCCC